MTNTCSAVEPRALYDREEHAEPEAVRDAYDQMVRDGRAGYGELPSQAQQSGTGLRQGGFA